MGSILLRIEQIAINEGITLTALEKQIGASKAVLTRALNNNTDISTKWIKRIVEIYQLYSIDWIITGEGEMLKNTSSYGENQNLSNDTVNNHKELYVKTSSIDKLIDVMSSQQRVIESQCETIAELTKKNSGTKGNGKSASSA